MPWMFLLKWNGTSYREEGSVSSSVSAGIATGQVGAIVRSSSEGALAIMLSHYCPNKKEREEMQKLLLLLKTRMMSFPTESE